MPSPTNALTGEAPRVRPVPIGRWPEGVVRRLTGLTVAGICGVVLGLAFWLTPDGAGHGTHMQLGLPPCGWVMAMNRPCPTCGMTTAFAHAAHGRLVEAAIAQPFGLLAAVGTAVAFWVGVHVAATGSHLGRHAARMMTPRTLWTLAGLAAAAWAYKWITWPGA